MYFNFVDNGKIFHKISFKYVKYPFLYFFLSNLLFRVSFFAQLVKKFSLVLKNGS